MRLTDYEKSMLNGDQGEMRRQAMEALCDLHSQPGQALVQPAVL